MTPLPTGTGGTQTANFGPLRLRPYNLVNLSLGLKWNSGLETVLYANNVFDTNPRLSLDRERGGRARIGYIVGQPRSNPCVSILR